MNMLPSNSSYNNAAAHARKDGQHHPKKIPLKRRQRQQLDQIRSFFLHQTIVVEGGALTAENHFHSSVVRQQSLDQLNPEVHDISGEGAVGQAGLEGLPTLTVTTAVDEAGKEVRLPVTTTTSTSSQRMLRPWDTLLQAVDTVSENEHLQAPQEYYDRLLADSRRVLRQHVQRMAENEDRQSLFPARLGAAASRTKHKHHQQNSAPTDYHSQKRSAVETTTPNLSNKWPKHASFRQDSSTDSTDSRRKEIQAKGNSYDHDKDANLNHDMPSSEKRSVDPSNLMPPPNSVLPAAQRQQQTNTTMFNISPVTAFLPPASNIRKPPPPILATPKLASAPASDNRKDPPPTTTTTAPSQMRPHAASVPTDEPQQHNMVANPSVAMKKSTSSKDVGGSWVPGIIPTKLNLLVREEKLKNSDMSASAKSPERAKARGNVGRSDDGGRRQIKGTHVNHAGKLIMGHGGLTHPPPWQPHVKQNIEPTPTKVNKPYYVAQNATKSPPATNLGRNIKSSTLTGMEATERYDHAAAADTTLPTTDPELAEGVASADSSDSAQTYELDSQEESQTTLNQSGDRLRHTSLWKGVSTADMVALMEEYGPEVDIRGFTSHILPEPSTKKKFRQWNPNFFRYFTFDDTIGKWVPVLGKEAELRRRREGELRGRLLKPTTLKNTSDQQQGMEKSLLNMHQKSLQTPQDDEARQASASEHNSRRMPPPACTIPKSGVSASMSTTGSDITSKSILSVDFRRQTNTTVAPFQVAVTSPQKEAPNYLKLSTTSYVDLYDRGSLVLTKDVSHASGTNSPPQPDHARALRGGNPVPSYQHEAQAILFLSRTEIHETTLEPSQALVQAKGISNLPGAVTETEAKSSAGKDDQNIALTGLDVQGEPAKASISATLDEKLPLPTSENAETKTSFSSFCTQNQTTTVCATSVSSSAPVTGVTKCAESDLLVVHHEPATATIAIKSVQVPAQPNSGKGTMQSQIENSNSTPTENDRNRRSDVLFVQAPKYTEADQAMDDDEPLTGSITLISEAPPSLTFGKVEAKAANKLYHREDLHQAADTSSAVGDSTDVKLSVSPTEARVSQKRKATSDISKVTTKARLSLTGCDSPSTTRFTSLQSVSIPREMDGNTPHMTGVVATAPFANAMPGSDLKRTPHSLTNSGSIQPTTDLKQSIYPARTPARTALLTQDNKDATTETDAPIDTATTVARAPLLTQDNQDATTDAKFRFSSAAVDWFTNQRQASASPRNAADSHKQSSSSLVDMLPSEPQKTLLYLQMRTGFAPVRGDNSVDIHSHDSVNASKLDVSASNDTSAMPLPEKSAKVTTVGVVAQSMPALSVRLEERLVTEPLSAPTIDVESLTVSQPKRESFVATVDADSSSTALVIASQPIVAAVKPSTLAVGRRESPTSQPYTQPEEPPTSEVGQSRISASISSMSIKANTVSEKKIHTTGFGNECGVTPMRLTISNPIDRARQSPKPESPPPQCQVGQEPIPRSPKPTHGHFKIDDTAHLPVTTDLVDTRAPETIAAAPPGPSIKESAFTKASRPLLAAYAKAKAQLNIAKDSIIFRTTSNATPMPSAARFDMQQPSNESVTSPSSVVKVGSTRSESSELRLSSSSAKEHDSTGIRLNSRSPSAALLSAEAAKVPFSNMETSQTSRSQLIEETTIPQHFFVQDSINAILDSAERKCEADTVYMNPGASESFDKNIQPPPPHEATKATIRSYSPSKDVLDQEVFPPGLNTTLDRPKATMKKLTAKESDRNDFHRPPGSQATTPDCDLRAVKTTPTSTTSLAEIATSCETSVVNDTPENEMETPLEPNPAIQDAAKPDSLVPKGSLPDELDETASSEEAVGPIPRTAPRFKKLPRKNRPKMAATVPRSIKSDSVASSDLSIGTPTATFPSRRKSTSTVQCCHACRKKSNEYRRCTYWVWSKCGKRFCRNCLETKFGQTEDWSLLNNKDWHCPACLKMCKCGPCLKLRHRESTEPRRKSSREKG